MTAIRTRRTIDAAGAAAVIQAAETVARRREARVVVAVVDPSGELIQLRRTPGAQIASSRVAVDKARTAAIFVRPSRELEEQVSSGRLGALALHGASALTGGIPLVAGGEVVGARLVNERLFAVTTPGFPDGIKVDAAGRVYASSARGIQIFHPLGELLEEIELPGAVNFTFGGAERNTLFITTDTAVWSCVVDAKGA